MDEHPSQSSWRDPELVGLPSESLVISFVEAQSDGFRHQVILTTPMRNDAVCIAVVPHGDPYRAAGPDGRL